MLKKYWEVVKWLRCYSVIEAVFNDSIIIQWPMKIEVCNDCDSIQFNDER